MTQNKRAVGVLLIIFTSLILLTGVVNAITGNIGNAKMILSETLYPELGGVDGSSTVTIQKTILVRNVNDAAINITLVSDSEGEKFLEIVDDNFILQPDEEKKALFFVKVKEPGTYNGKINVLFAPTSDTGAGVALSSSITVIAGKGSSSSEEQTGNTDEETGANVSLGGSPNLQDKEDNNGESGKILLLMLPSLILLIVLIYLLVLMNKKMNKRKNKRRNK